MRFMVLRNIIVTLKSPWSPLGKLMYEGLISMGFKYAAAKLTRPAPDLLAADGVSVATSEFIGVAVFKTADMNVLWLKPLTSWVFHTCCMAAGGFMGALLLRIRALDVLEPPLAICRCSCSRSAAPPATNGVAWLVPLVVVYPVKFPSPTAFAFVVVMIFEPGALNVGKRLRLASCNRVCEAARPEDPRQQARLTDTAALSHKYESSC